MTRNFSSVAMAVSRSALNADIDGISVTKHFRVIKYAGRPLRSRTCALPAYILYISTCEKVNCEFYFSNVTSDEANFHPMLHCDRFKCQHYFYMKKTRLEMLSMDREKWFQCSIICMNQDNTFIGQQINEIIFNGKK